MTSDAPRPRALVLRSAGTNCDLEAVRVLELAGADVDSLHLNRLVESPDRLGDYQLMIIAGGFSYGDDVAAGRVFGFELGRTLGEPLRAWVDAGGLVTGICNGFQILVESGLLDVGGEGAGQDERSVALYTNASDRFECRWVELEGGDCACPWVVPGERLPCPVAHAEGRFAVRDDATLARLVERRQIAYVYRAPDGGEAAYPHNPNGSVASIAGICDPTGRVLGLMPHPERNVSPWNSPGWTRLSESEREARRAGEGLAFFERMVAAARSASATETRTTAASP